jgi:hypothetical protein
MTDKTWLAKNWWLVVALTRGLAVSELLMRLILPEWSITLLPGFITATGPAALVIGFVFVYGFLLTVAGCISVAIGFALESKRPRQFPLVVQFVLCLGLIVVLHYYSLVFLPAKMHAQQADQHQAFCEIMAARKKLANVSLSYDQSSQEYQLHLTFSAGAGGKYWLSPEVYRDKFYPQNSGSNREYFRFFYTQPEVISLSQAQTEYEMKIPKANLDQGYQEGIVRLFPKEIHDEPMVARFMTTLTPEVTYGIQNRTCLIDGQEVDASDLLRPEPIVSRIEYRYETVQN